MKCNQKEILKFKYITSKIFFFNENGKTKDEFNKIRICYHRRQPVNLKIDQQELSNPMEKINIEKEGRKNEGRKEGATGFGKEER